MTFLKLGGAVGVFAWATVSSDCRSELQVESESEPDDRQREFRKSLLCSTVYVTFAVTEFISTRTA